MKLLVSVLGETDYLKALYIQEKLLCLRQENKVPDIMLLLQHPPTLTIGKRENKANILLPEQDLQGMVSVVRTNRGGDVTYHGPGQIVGYPILDLKYHGNSIKGYIHKLEEIFIELLNKEYHLDASTDNQYRGVWIGKEKITAIGCAVKKGVTMHGFAFNVNTNLDNYKWINPCGISDKGVTSLEKTLGKSQDIEQVNGLIVKHFSNQFNLQPEIISKKQLYQFVGF